MAWSSQEYQEFLEAFYQHPEWQDQLRQLILTQELLRLPAGFEELRRAQQLIEQSLHELVEAQKHTEQTVAELTEAQKKSEERLTRLEQAVAELTEAQKKSEERLTRLEQAVAELTKAQKKSEERLTRLEQTVAELTEAQKKSEERLTRLEQAVAELTEAQKKSEERLTRLEQTVAELTEAQKKSEERLTRLEQTVAELAEAQKRTEQRVEELAEAQKKTEGRVDRLDQIVTELAKVQKKLVREVGELRGDMLEIRYRQRAFSYLGQIASRIKVVDLQDVLPKVEPYLNDKEYGELLALDVLVSGRLRASLAERIGESSIWIAIEVSGVVDKADVERARRRADLLGRANLKVLPLAAGQRWTKGARAAASELGVVLQQDGRLELLEAALEKLMSQNETGLS